MTVKKKSTNRRQNLQAQLSKLKIVESKDSARFLLEDLITFHDGELIHPLYRDIAKHALKTGEIHTLLVKLDVRVLAKLCVANDRNRTRQWPHVSALAGAMWADYRLELTDAAITTDGKVANGGHSIAALIAAFCPLDVFKRARLFFTTQVVKDKKGTEVINRDGTLKTELVPSIPSLKVAKGYTDDDGGADVIVPGEFAPEDRKTGLTELEPEADGEPIKHEIDTWTVDEVLADAQTYVDSAMEETGVRESDRYFRLTVNVSPEAVKKYDVIGRGRMGAEQLELSGPSRHFVQHRYPDLFSFKMLETVLKTLHLRAKVDPVPDEDGNVIYGTPKGGGNLDKSQFPVFFLAHSEGLIDSVAAASNGAGLSPNPDTLGRIPMKDILCVVAATTPQRASRLGSELRKGKHPDLVDLNRKLTPPTQAKAKRFWRKPDASAIQSVLMAVANGAKLDESDAAGDYIHQLAARGIGWDRGDHQSGERYVDALRDSSKVVDKMMNDDAKRANAWREKRGYTKRK